jgi:alanine-alpha-ketoisovalerate/valine-pyruvate aminotransferase
MKKLKLYIESSAISNLEQPNMPEAMADMKALWEMLKQGVYDVVISSVTLNEIAKRSRQMTMEEFYKMKDEKNMMLKKMTPEERSLYHKKETENVFKWLGKENFIPTNEPGVWRHIPKKIT